MQNIAMVVMNPDQEGKNVVLGIGIMTTKEEQSKEK